MQLTLALLRKIEISARAGPDARSKTAVLLLLLSRRRWVEIAAKVHSGRYLILFVFFSELTLGRKID